ncbi:ATP-binding protein [Streptomyces lavendulocolor]|uniref:ATP-binding protein n=1 Tax=Streptomyces lavendulocolor TaxID=67316 RepID=UPI0033BFE9FE
MPFIYGPAGISPVRSFVSVTLHSWGLGGLSSDVCLCASELVANAVLHTSPGCIPLHIRLLLTEKAVRLAVHDKSCRLPQPTQPTVNDESGRGMLIVSALANHWGADLLPSGKAVWAEFTLPDLGAPDTGNRQRLPPALNNFPQSRAPVSHSALP